jgi:methyl-accepting chemotaxis protein
MTDPAGNPSAPRRHPLMWALTLTFALASLVGIVALSSNLAATDALLTEGVGQTHKISETTSRGVVANHALPAIDAAVQDSAPAVVSTIEALRRADGSLRTLSARIRELADVLDRARRPLTRTVDTAAHTERTVRRALDPAGRIIDTLRAVDRRVADLGPALDRTLTTSRSIEAKLRVLGLLPGG